MNMSLFDNMPTTAVKEIPEIAKIDLLIFMITLKYTQSQLRLLCKWAGSTIGVSAVSSQRCHCPVPAAEIRRCNL